MHDVCWCVQFYFLLAVVCVCVRERERESQSRPHTHSSVSDHIRELARRKADWNQKLLRNQTTACSEKAAAAAAAERKKKAQIVRSKTNTSTSAQHVSMRWPRQSWLLKDHTGLHRWVVGHFEKSGGWIKQQKYLNQYSLVQWHH